MKRLAPIVMVLAATACTPAAPPEVAAPPAAASVAETLGLMVGVLEPRSETQYEQARTVVRVVFANDGTGWKSLDPKCSDLACLQQAPAKFPTEVNWTIAHQGQVVGAVPAVIDVEFKTYGDVGTQHLDGGINAPTVGEPTLDFGNGDGRPVHRPLVAVSTPNVADPDGWAPADLTPAAQAAVVAAFRTQFASVENCASPEENVPKPVTYTEKDVGIFGGFGSNKGWFIASANLDGYLCDGPMDGVAYAPQTYAIAPDGKVQNLGEWRTLLDAGDYDNDGKSEVVFAIDPQNAGGYDLRFNDFSGVAEFPVIYH